MFRWLHDLACVNSAHHAMLRVIEANIMCCPEEWNADSYEAWNDQRGLKMWIANNAYGFQLWDGPNRHRSPEIHLSGIWKRRLWAAWRGKNRSTEKARQIVARFDDRAVAKNDNVIAIQRK